MRSIAVEMLSMMQWQGMSTVETDIDDRLVYSLSGEDCRFDRKRIGMGYRNRYDKR